VPASPRTGNGTIEDWPHKHGLLADACDRGGAFLDVGCASGYLAALGPVPRRRLPIPKPSWKLYGSNPGPAASSTLALV